jgi:hypothetical protein
MGNLAELEYLNLDNNGLLPVTKLKALKRL